MPSGDRRLWVGWGHQRRSSEHCSGGSGLTTASASTPAAPTPASSTVANHGTPPAICFRFSTGVQARAAAAGAAQALVGRRNCQRQGGLRSYKHGALGRCGDGYVRSRQRHALLRCKLLGLKSKQNIMRK